MDNTANQSSDAILDRMMALHPKIIDLTLDRVWRLLKALDDPQEKLPPVIHIAGTNGKGSTQAMIRAGIEGMGKSAHAYTSPHLAKFHERIRLAGELISEEHLTEVLDECYAKNDGIDITYFEITTCAALLAFARTKADYTLLEVGLGGRLDATNVITPEISVITPVSKDHEQFLGDTIDKIAAEKAGIIKRGVPCVVGPQDDAAMDVIEATALRLGAPLLVYGQHWHVSTERGRLIYQDDHGLLDLPMPALLGAHQVINAGAALAVLRHLGADDAACEAAMVNAEWPARMQRLKSGPLIDIAGDAELWLDGGHNAAAGIAIAELLKALPQRNVHLICGMLNTKDVNGYLAPIAKEVVSLTAVSIPGEANTLPAEATALAAAQVGMEAKTAANVATALKDIIADHPDCRVLICGSLYLAGVVLRENG
ncbi:bifunctional folylpolyglutamate synthase/dihydrofolate synthase [Cognatishimia activa]|uniref:Dihydrofolate synthase/folylpolyglutamate synthase n=1 Tax=Cognatishimia activa TaxID=1715691 RepID=A0A0N7MB89_9RHOB|nr:folylpolyglutamate synthase/dihydrofolate synthase family protein [Cognatishimia activa]CUI36302.1 Folylpolyglutamate synthase [Cognatishimia activa]CUK24736.1 Folylpolyglutamate synthase [Cognatishimia activa]